MPKQHSLIASFRCALRGIWVGLSSQRNLKLQACIASLVIVVGVVLQVSLMEWCLLLCSLSMVLTAELINTSLESLVDLVSPDYHALARNSKDIAAGAVLVSSLLAAIVGVITFLPKVIAWWG